MGNSVDWTIVNRRGGIHEVAGAYALPLSRYGSGDWNRPAEKRCDSRAWSRIAAAVTCSVITGTDDASSDITIGGEISGGNCCTMV